ncbi:MAG TPA: S41 family peptidase [Candidatus Paceibacterota bacterium]
MKFLLRLFCVFVFVFYSQIGFAQNQEQNLVLTRIGQDSDQKQLSDKERADLETKRKEILQMILSIKDPEIIKELSNFFIVSRAVQNFYVDQELQSRLLKLAMHGMIEGLDPYSNLFLDEDAKLISKKLSGEDNFVGIGIEIINFSKNIVITNVFDGSPASRAGLAVRDIILKVDGKTTFGMTTAEVAHLVTGLEGTRVSLEIKNQHLQKPKVIEILRQKIIVESVSYKALKNNLAYIKIRSFLPETPARFSSALSSSSNKNLIIDLRNNGGGDLDSTVKMIGYLVGPGKLVTTLKYRNSNEEFLTPDDYSFDSNKPSRKIVILINNNSASASEVMSGNLKHYKVATLMGVRTYGKATAQNYLGLDNLPLSISNLILGITVARFYLPDGSNITGEGVQPDMEVEQPEDFKPFDYLTKKDIQFQAAVKFLKNK